MESRSAILAASSYRREKYVLARINARFVIARGYYPLLRIALSRITAFRQPRCQRRAISPQTNPITIRSRIEDTSIAMFPSSLLLLLLLLYFTIVIATVERNRGQAVESPMPRKCISLPRSATIDDLGATTRAQPSDSELRDGLAR